MVKWIGCYGRRNRHTFDVNDGRDVLYLGCTAENCNAPGISTHNSDVVKVVNCTVRECGGGIIVRGSNTMVRGNHILGSRLNAESNNETFRSGIIVEMEVILMTATPALTL